MPLPRIRPILPPHAADRYRARANVQPAPRNGRLLTPAGAINHTDEEMEFLAGLVNQRTAWQVSGRKGIKDGSGGAAVPANNYGTGNSYGPPGSRD